MGKFSFAHPVDLQLLVLHVDDIGADAIHEVLRVRDDHQYPLVAEACHSQ